MQKALTNLDANTCEDKMHTLHVHSEFWHYSNDSLTRGNWLLSGFSPRKLIQQIMKVQLCNKLEFNDQE